MKNKFTAKRLAVIAVTSALLIVGKFALSFIPNVEVVTTLIICYAFVFKFDSVFATLIFCTADIFIYPPSLDVIISYYVYWNLLAISVSFLSEIGVKKEWVYIAISGVFTLLFGVITSFFSHLFYGVPFIAIYVSGLNFYALQLLSAVVFTLVGFKPIVKLFLRVKNKIEEG